MWNAVLIVFVVTVFGVIAFDVAYELESERDAEKRGQSADTLT